MTRSKNNHQTNTILIQLPLAKTKEQRQKWNKWMQLSNYVNYDRFDSVYQYLKSVW